MYKNKLKAAMTASWLLTVFSSFLGSAFFVINVPHIGAIYPFRVLLPTTVVLYAVWITQNESNIWKESSIVEKLCWLLAAIMLLHSAISLPFAIDFRFSFRRLFNLTFDLCYFILALRLCRERKFLYNTLRIAGVAILLLCVAGIYEVFSGGIVNDAYDKYIDFEFLGIAGQSPIVTYDNTNDFVSELVFIFASILLYWGYSYSDEKRNSWAIYMFFPLCYLLIRAAGSRLVSFAIWTLLSGVVVFFLIVNKKRMVIPVAILVLLLCINLTSGYMGPNISLREELLNSNASGGIRLRLLQHAWNCFVESGGMGVGIGNTEQLVKLTIAKDIRGIWNVHCFIARIVADYGIWVLLPLCAIAYCLIAKGIKLVIAGIRYKIKRACAVGTLYLFVLLTYPFLSTASSDAQDLLAMWLFLAIIVVCDVNPIKYRSSADL